MTQEDVIIAANADTISADKTVWRGDDGSFIIGDDWDVTEATCEYVDAGTLGEYATK